MPGFLQGRLIALRLRAPALGAPQALQAAALEAELGVALDAAAELMAA